MSQAGARQKEEHHLLVSKKHEYHLSVTVNVTVKKVIEDSQNKTV